MTDPLRHSDPDRRAGSISAAMTRLARRRNPGYQRVDAKELRDALTLFVTRFFRALDGGPTGPVFESIASAATRRMQQGLHPLEVFGAWIEVRQILESVAGDEPVAGELLDQCEQTMIDSLKKGVELHSPYAWPAREVGALERAAKRLTVGLQLIEQSAGEAPKTPMPALTRREREILTLASGGMTTDQIAAQIGISRATVHTYVTRAISKLGAVNRMHAVAVAVSLGLIVPPTA